jgi:Tfp pilus assembly protein PilF
MGHLSRGRLLSLVLALLFSCALSWFFALPAYRHWKEHRAVTRARAFLECGDLAKANLSARQALSLNPTNLDACLLMAEMAQRIGAPQALDWRRRIAELSPTLDHKFAFAQTALALESAPFPLCTQVLEDVAPAAAESADYHLLAAQLALKLNRIGQAELHLATATRLQPQHALTRLNLAVVQLLSTNQTTAESARAILVSFVTHTNLGPLALRSLVADALKRKQFTNAESYCNTLLAHPAATFADRLQQLTVLREAARPEFDATLASLQRSAVTNAPAAWSLANWMNRNGLTAQTVRWLAHCPAQLRTNPPVALALADSLVAAQDWPALEQFLQPQDWHDLDFARLALRARAAAGLHNQVAADGFWRLATRQAAQRLGPLTSLLALAQAWNFPAVRENLLAQIVETSPRQRWAYQELLPRYLAAGNTRALNRISALLAQSNPQDTEARNNLAATSLLLKIDTAQAHQIARENVGRQPKDPVLVATYAFSLHLQGRTQDGLAAFEALDSDALRAPGIALYYGVLLSATHQRQKANVYLGLVAPSQLLPEERQLLALAREGT